LPLIFNDFQNSFTAGKGKKFATRIATLSAAPYCVAALLCEITENLKMQ